MLLPLLLSVLDYTRRNYNMSKSISGAPNGPKQGHVGQLINDVFEINKSETLTAILENKQLLNLDDVSIGRIAELIRVCNEKSRTAALDQLVKLYN
jgi:hypothetical protein